MPIGYPHKVSLTITDADKYLRIINWLKTNIKGKVFGLEPLETAMVVGSANTIRNEEGTISPFIFYFSRKGDAILFKLTWC